MEGRPPGQGPTLRPGIALAGSDGGTCYQRQHRWCTALLRTNFGSSVERTAKLHPLWQVQGAVLHVLDSVEARVGGGSLSLEKRRVDLGHGAALLDHRKGVGRQFAGVHVAKRPLKNMPRVTSRERAPCRGRWGQPGPPDHHTDPDGSDQDGGLLRRATPPVAITAPTVAAPLSGSQPCGCGMRVGRQ